MFLKYLHTQCHILIPVPASPVQQQGIIHHLSQSDTLTEHVPVHMQQQEHPVHLVRGYQYPVRKFRFIGWGIRLYCSPRLSIGISSVITDLASCQSFMKFLILSFFMLTSNQFGIAATIFLSAGIYDIFGHI